MEGERELGSGRTPPSRSGAPEGIRSAIRDHRGLAAFAATYLTGFLVYGLVAHRPSTVAYTLTVSTIILLVAELDSRVHFSRVVLWGLAAWGVLHLAGGLIPVGDGVLYNADLHVPTLHYDRLIHALGFGVATIAVWQSLRPHLAGHPEGRSVAVIAALGGLGLGALNEVVEFAVTHLSKDSNVGGYQNTGWDLVYNMLGCTVAAIFVHRSARRRSRDVPRTGAPIPAHLTGVRE